MRKIALIGTADTGVDAPYDDESWEICGVATRAAYTTRATRWFELHRLDGEGPCWAAGWRANLTKYTDDCELWMMYPEFDLSERVIVYPSEAISERFGTYFMTSSFAWMMALAIDELRPLNGDPVDGVIGVWGVEMEYGTEYRQQRAGMRHFLDLAKQLGIGVSRLVSGGLAYEPIPYPMWQDDPLQNKLERRNKITIKELARLDKSIRMTRSMLAQNRSVMEELSRADKKEYDIKARIEEVEKEYHDLLSTSSDISKSIVGLEAVDREQTWLTDYLQP